MDKLVEEVQEVSHPSRVRGLKLVEDAEVSNTSQVAPLAGAWIEMF